MKKIAVLTSGGDCAGLNAAIRGVVYHAEKLGWSVYGIMQGTRGLLVDPPLVWQIHRSDFNGTVMRQGGTILGSNNKGNPFHFPQADGTFKDLSGLFVSNFRKLGLDALIGIGGDGSLDVLLKLTEKENINLIGIPKTIDNDVGETEVAIGFDTAVSVATEALDRLQPTAASHDRVMVLEVMGRDAGHIALNAGIAGGADVILIPEIPYDIRYIVEKIRAIQQLKRNFALVVVSEAVKTLDGEQVNASSEGERFRFGGVGHYIGDLIAKETGAQTRVTVLGHLQRGGIPSANDRIIASAFGTYAVELIRQNKQRRMVAWKNRQVIDVPIEQAIQSYRAVDVNESLVQTARNLGICLGDS